MGWTFDEDGLYDHAGYAAHLIADGRRVAATSGQGLLIRRQDESRIAAAWAAGRTPSSEDMYDLVPWGELVGWQARCECGWLGPTWDRTSTTPSRTDDQPWRGVDPDDARLRDGRSVDDAAHDAWLQHMQPLLTLSHVTGAAAAVAEARGALDDAVKAARAEPTAASWADIGRAAGISRQSAHERWG